MSELRSLNVDVQDVIERVRVPSYVIGSDGVVLWLNPAARALVGDVRGRHVTTLVPQEEAGRVQQIFTRNLLGPPEGSDNEGVVLDADGERLSVEVSAVPLRDGSHVMGVFGQVKDIAEDGTPAAPDSRLTPRQSEVLRLLERGYSTDQIGQELHLSTETVRNHVRAILQALNVHSRLEAVALSRRVHA